jgi:hypothetical protein
MKFVDRRSELTALRERLRRPASFSLVYGQRRVGKTWLLQHLLQRSSDALYFLADEATAPSLLRRFRQAVADAGRGGSAWGVDDGGDWGTTLTLLVQQAALERRRLVLVLDELQYLLAAVPELPSVLQRLWDEYHSRLRLHLVLCGSALGTLAALGESGQPLHGRFDLKMKVRPFGYREAAEFAPRWGRADRLRLYGVFGGLARHLAEVDPRRGLADNAVRALVDPLGALHEAPLDILRSEHLSAHADANAVLAAVAAGEDRFNMLAARTGLGTARLDYVLKELIALEVLRREVRAGDQPGSRYARYRCTDPLMAFWFRQIRSHGTAALGVEPAALWRERIEPRLDDHMGPVFEEVVRQAVLNGALARAIGPVDAAAPYWSRDGSTEIDLVVRSGAGTLYLEAKWRIHGVLGLADLHLLRAHVSRVPDVAAGARLGLATAGRIAPTLRRVAGAEGVLLLGPGDLLP